MSQTEASTHERYASAADEVEALLCCPVSYNPKYLEAIPQEVIEKDYGCGDPSCYLKEGETVLDLGSGTGKICFIAAQVVGAKGKVIGVDMTDAMLQVARRNAPKVAQKIGFSNVEFRKGRIQDLALDLELVNSELGVNPTEALENTQLAPQLDTLRKERPLIPDASVDVVVSNCVLNLVDATQKRKLFKEIHRVLKVGGRAVISDIVSDKAVPERLQKDQDLWSGCISGSLQELAFLQAFEAVGFQAIQVLNWQNEPWQKVEGIEFRSVTLEASKFEPSKSAELTRSVIYKGPFAKVHDDAGRCYPRGERTAISEASFKLLCEGPQADAFIFIGADVAGSSGCCSPSGNSEAAPTQNACC